MNKPATLTVLSYSVNGLLYRSLRLHWNRKYGYVVEEESSTPTCSSFSLVIPAWVRLELFGQPNRTYSNFPAPTSLLHP